MKSILVVLVVLAVWVFITPWLFAHGSGVAFKLGCATIGFGLMGLYFALWHVSYGGKSK